MQTFGQLHGFPKGQLEQGMDVRIVVRLPAGIMRIYKDWANDLLGPNKLARRMLVEVALSEIMLRSARGCQPDEYEFPLRTYSLVIDRELLARAQTSARQGNIRCSRLIGAALVEYLHCNGGERAQRLGKVRR